jgi:hypothetical protein
MSKYEDVRIVTFKEDYSVPKLDGEGKQIVIDGKPQVHVYYKKSTGPNDKHAMHKNVVKKLEDSGAKMSVETFDRKAYVVKEKAKLLKRDKSSFSVERR